MAQILLETDSRRRLSLARLGVESSSYYLAEQRADGTILLVPAEVRPKLLEVVERVDPNWADHAAVTNVAERTEWADMRDQALQDDDAV